MRKVNTQILSSQAYILPVALLLISVRDLLQENGRILASVHVLALIVARAVAPRLTRQTVVGLAAVCLSAGPAFMLSQTLTSDGFCSGCDSRSLLNLGLLAVAYLTTFAVFLIRWQTQKVSFWSQGLLAICAAIPLVQVVLLLAAPKLCLACILAGVAAILATSFALDEPVEEGVRLRRLFVSTFVGIATLAVAGAFVHRPDRSRDVMVNLTGLPASTAGLVCPPDERKHIVLLALPGCHFCADAEAWFRDHGIAIQIEDIGQAKFTSTRIPQGFAPQVLVLRKGSILAHIVGYDKIAYDKLKEIP